MKKIIAFCVFFLMFGVVVNGSGVSINVFKPQKILEGRQIGYISYGSACNSSFLAPMPINYSFNPFFSPFYNLIFTSRSKIISNN